MMEQINNRAHGYMLRRYFEVATLMTKPKSVHLLAKELQVSERSVHRYIRALREAGFTIESKTVSSTPKYRLTGLPDKLSQIIQSISL